jgi:hypothetical protein
MGPLGREVPDDWEHVERYPLTATTTPEKPVPLVGGFNWYPEFDAPVRDTVNRQRQWWVRMPGPGSRPRGGHCICFPPENLVDPAAWWDFYDQLREGKCVGEGGSRMMSLLNRKRYDPTWLWNRAKEVDEWDWTNPGDDNGTSVRAAMDVLRLEGHKPWRGAGHVKPEEGISANRWATSVDDALNALRSPKYEKLGAVPFLNSWGRSYPHKTLMPLEVLARLLDEYGELALVTDR